MATIITNILVRIGSAVVLGTLGANLSMGGIYPAGRHKFSQARGLSSLRRQTVSEVNCHAQQRVYLTCDHRNISNQNQ